METTKKNLRCDFPPVKPRGNVKPTPKCCRQSLANMGVNRTNKRYSTDSTYVLLAGDLMAKALNIRTCLTLYRLFRPMLCSVTLCDAL